MTIRYWTTWARRAAIVLSGGFLLQIAVAAYVGFNPRSGLPAIPTRFVAAPEPEWIYMPSEGRLFTVVQYDDAAASSHVIYWERTDAPRRSADLAAQLVGAVPVVIQDALTTPTGRSPLAFGPQGSFGLLERQRAIDTAVGFPFRSLGMTAIMRAHPGRHEPCFIPPGPTPPKQVFGSLRTPPKLAERFDSQPAGVEELAAHVPGAILWRGAAANCGVYGAVIAAIWAAHRTIVFMLRRRDSA